MAATKHTMKMPELLVFAKMFVVGLVAAEVCRTTYYLGTAFVPAIADFPLWAKAIPVLIGLAVCVVSRYSRLIKGKADVSFLGFKLSLEPSQETVDELLDDIDEVLRRIGRRVIVVIDDLDRLDAKTVNNVLFATRRTFKLSQATYVLCYDTEVLAGGKEEGSGSHAKYETRLPPLLLARNLLHFPYPSLRSIAGARTQYSRSKAVNSSLINLAFAAAVFSVSASHANPVTFDAVLNGSSEEPANASPGTGFASVDFDLALHTMRVRVNFSGLLAGNTAAHIHCCTAVANAGNVGVATTTPTFPGFPSGATAGIYDHTFDMSSALSYNAAFIAANGGTALGAEAALYAGMATGASYLNIHSSVLPGGEIRGFLQVPEPGSLALFGFGLAGLALSLRKRQAGAIS